MSDDSKLSTTSAMPMLSRYPARPTNQYLTDASHSPYSARRLRPSALQLQLQLQEAAKQDVAKLDVVKPDVESAQFNKARVYLAMFGKRLQAGYTLRSKPDSSSGH